MNKFTPFITDKLGIATKYVENTLSLFDSGATIPFISRYRKEATGNMDEVMITEVKEYYTYLLELSKRKETVIKTITEQGKMTKELQEQIENCVDATLLEDIYLPYKPKRRTKAQVARENGLEPLATILLLQREKYPQQKAKDFLSNSVLSVEEAIKGAQHIIAEQVSEEQSVRAMLRKEFDKEAKLVVKVKKGKDIEEEAHKFSDYFNHSELLKRCSAHRYLAILRGENEGILSVNIEVDDDFYIEKIQRKYISYKTACSTFISEAIEDAYKRLLFPAIKNELLQQYKEKADEEAIHIFSENLKQLLLSAPLGQKRVLGVDPGFRTGCKLVCVDSEGNLLTHDVIYPHPPHSKIKESEEKLITLVRQYDIEAIAVGNGTAGRETLSLIRNISFTTSPNIFMVSEDGASIYSASKIAREEFPHEDVTVRGAVSIARRLMDPLAELVKIDAKSIGIGQYQHDVDQAKLKSNLDRVVEHCVNTVGVNLNTASVPLLTYVSGLGSSLAQNIVNYRKEHGAFKSRESLKKVPRLGTIAFQQCAGFLRIPQSKNPLDNTSVHPESYYLVEKMAKDCGETVESLIKNKEKQNTINLQQYVTQQVGMPTLQDIMKELDKPGRDPRMTLEPFEYDERVKTIDDLVKGMVLSGIITNITNFGVFVDIGVHQDGLVHISQVSNQYITNLTDVVKLHDHVQVKVLDIDQQRKRISLTMKDI